MVSEFSLICTGAYLDIPAIEKKRGTLESIIDILSQAKPNPKFQIFKKADGIVLKCHPTSIIRHAMQNVILMVLPPLKIKKHSSPKATPFREEKRRNVWV